MHSIELVVQAVCIALEIVTLAFLWRLGGWRQLPVFSAYLIFILLRTVIGSLALSSPSFYFKFYWISAPLEILFTIAAVLESFWRVFGSFRLLRWFRVVLPAVFGGALAYSAWRGYYYDRFALVEMPPAASALVRAIVMMHYAILAVAILYFAQAALLHVTGRVHEDRLVLGFGVASLAAAFGGSIRGAFGEALGIVSREAQPVGYLIAVCLWLSAVTYPGLGGSSHTEMRNDFIVDLQFQLRNLRSFVRKGAR
jgi:hypothetical protein